MNDLVTPMSNPDTVARLTIARRAGVEWAAEPLARRLAVVRRARRLIAQQAATLASMVSSTKGGRPVAETLVAEVLPLLEAARFLERRAAALLAPRRVGGGLGAGRPLWLFGVSATIRREPLGAVLIVGPSNYPLFLPAAQALQALVAGNAVCLKPAPEGVAAAAAFAAMMTEAGLPDGVLQVLGAADGPAAVASGFDRIVLTGSAETGARVLAAAAPMLTPATMELSGSDAVFVLPGADLPLVARCLAYGLRLNGGATCIAPRRVFVTRDRAAALEAALLTLLPGVPDADVPDAVAGRLQALLTQAAGMGGRVLTRQAAAARPGRPAVLADARAEMPLLQQDVFAPWLALVPVGSMEEALRADARCPFALGASIFGPVGAATALAARVRAGSVCINDLIVPTADPRLPFGGGGRSGFGRTRGAEGLLEFCAIKTVSVRRGRFRPHLAPPTEADVRRFAGMALLLHGGWGQVGPALRALSGR